MRQKVKERKMTAGEKKARIKEDLKTEINSLNIGDRRLLSCHFGYLGVVGHRKEHKDWKTANLYIKCQLFPLNSAKEEQKRKKQEQNLGDIRNEENRKDDVSINEDIVIGEEDIEAEIKPLDNKKEINLEMPYSTIFDHDEDSLIKFFVEDGVNLSETEQVSMVRLFQVRTTVREKKNF